MRKSEWGENDGLLTFGGRIYVPDANDLRRRIMAQYHDSQVAGHPGRMKTLELISRDYWWPQMARHVGQYTSTCETCLRNKVIRRRPFGELVPLETPQGRWEKVSVDFITELASMQSWSQWTSSPSALTSCPQLCQRMQKGQHVCTTRTSGSCMVSLSPGFMIEDPCSSRNS